MVSVQTIKLIEDETDMSKSPEEQFTEKKAKALTMYLGPHCSTMIWMEALHWLLLFLNT